MEGVQVAALTPDIAAAVEPAGRHARRRGHAASIPTARRPMAACSAATSSRKSTTSRSTTLEQFRAAMHAAGNQAVAACS